MNNRAHHLPIAVVGLAGRFPDAADASAFWRNLENGIESLTSFSDAELAASGIEAKYLDDPNFVKKGTFLEGAELFDAAFFGLSPLEAETLDPQHRLFLECSWEAMEDAGYFGESGGGPVGVFAGCSMNSYLLTILARNRAALEAAGPYQLMIGNDKDFLATRVSYKLNLTGPSVTLQTACSTSLVAVQMACQSLQARQCDMALAGGVALHFPQKTGHLYVPGMIFSPDGHCRPFDSHAGGIRGGAGAGVVVLKRLADALHSGDSIRAVILGAAVNNDGAGKMGYTAPSVEGQAAVVTAALAAGRVDPASISYVEAHGTATPVGDPIEIAALERAFGSTDRKRFCAIGSVKGNIGHLDAAAGVAGLIKTVLALEHKRIPASLNFREPNPQIDFANSPFFVNDKLGPWDSPDGPRRAGVSSFGIGGSNAHVVLEEAPAPEQTVVRWPTQLLTLSARSSSALEAATVKVTSYLAEHPSISLADACYTMQIGRKRFPHRRVVICSTREEALKTLASGDRRTMFSALEDAVRRPVTFMFTGQGSQHAGMARGLYEFQPVFRQELDFCAEVLKPEIGCDLRDVLYSPSGDASVLNETWLAQPALFAVEYALARMWISWGVEPDSAIGHSIGEYVAACLAGVFSPEDALRLIAARGRIMQKMAPGSMLAVPLPERELVGLINGRISLAAINAPSLCTVSGTQADLAALQERLRASRIESRLLFTSHAFHSSAMDEAVEIFGQRVQRLRLCEPRLPFMSNLTGRPILAGEATDHNYWAQHLRQTVRFADGIRALASPGRIFLEVGPGQTLATFAQETSRGIQDCEVFASLPQVKDPQPESAFILKTLGKLWMAGVDLNWSGVHAGERLQRVSLPTYPFERQRYWAGDDGTRQEVRQAELPARKDDVADWFYAPSWTRSVMPSTTASGESFGPWLIFEDQGSLPGLVAHELAARGESYITVKRGTSFERLSERSYVIDSLRAEDYLRLLNETKDKGQAPRSVLYLWGLDGGREAFHSLLLLAQAFGDIGSRDPIDCTIVSAQMHSVTGREAVDPEQALLTGPCKVLPKEYPHIRCRSVDICPQDLSQALALELLLEPGMPRPSRPVAYRDGWRWQQTFEPIRLSSKPPRTRNRGVYLITGGMGGIGLSLATHLAETCCARVALIGRSSLPDRAQWQSWLADHREADQTSIKIRSLQRIEELGGEALPISADVCDRAAMERALDEIHQRFGPIHGVIHAAGVAGGRLMQLKTRDAAAQVIGPKVEGTLVLDSLVKDQPLDFFVLCSSVNALCGVAGAVDYTSANAFLDAFAASRYRHNRTPVISIDWDTWQEVGMAVNTHVPSDLLVERRTTLAAGIKPAEGVEAFWRAVDSKLPQVAVITRDFPRMLETLEQPLAGILENSKTPAIKLRERAPEGHPRPDLANDYAPPETETQRRVVEIWKTQFGIAEIGIDDNFFELGGHSLLATGVLARLGQAFALTVSLRAFFDAPTVRALSEHVDNLLWASLQVSPSDGESEEREEVEL
jgi:acyl transferase domain-containing protein